MGVNFPKIEEKILEFWKENRIFEKSIERRKKARNFVFYEGPPTANAKPGLHHVLARVYKDIICRYKTMRGFKVERKAGWDTHGLPVELEIEKKLNLKSKREIEKYGISKFNQQCRQSVWEYKKDWEDLTERIGFWIDMENPYITYHNDYIESLWWIIKQIQKRGLLYQDYKVLPYCPRCGTSLSSHEVALGYRKIKEPAIYVKFKLKTQNAKRKTGTKNLKLDTYLLVWTTTPWTLPGNVAVAVNPEFIYVRVKIGSELFILAKERLNVLAEDYTIVDEFKGKDLLGLKYEPLYLFYDHQQKYKKKAWFVIAGDFVSLEEGTGLVHIAPAFGEEDMEIGKKYNLPILLNVDEEGKFKSGVKPWAGIYVKQADPAIIEDLKKRELLFKEEEYEHDYPFCWRCESPLLYYAKQSWFIKITKIKKDLIKNNQKINWIPSHLKEGRFGEWLREVKDWALSRERYWGTPLPIWQCQKCKNLEVIGSKADLLKQNFSKNNYYLLRHGESLRNIEKIVCCWPEKIHCPLTAKGERQIKKAARELKAKKIDLIFSSDLLRTRQTSQIVARETGAKIIYDPRIREVNLGIYNGKSSMQAQQAWGEPLERFEKKVPGGESYTQVKKRMYDFLKDINQKYRKKNILIVSHECPLSMLEGACFGFSNQEIVEYRADDKKRIRLGGWRKLEFKHLPYDQKMQLDFHRPYLDQVKFFCPKCQGQMERAKEVIDCWFDSGAMPFAQVHWPFLQKSKISPPELFPADYISEAVDQTRGWFYTLLAISTLLGFGPCYRNVISLGHVLDEKGEKMSKSKGNVVDPWYIVDKFSADATRWYFFSVNQPGDAKLFREKEVEDVLRKFLMTFWNCYAFFELYGQKGQKLKFQPKNLLDRWIFSKMNWLIKEVTQKLDQYQVTGAARSIESFLIEDLSQWWIRRSRERFHQSKKEKIQASQTLNLVLLNLTKLCSVFMPFLSEEIYQKLKIKESVHLEDWPQFNSKLIQKKLEKKMELTRKICSLGLRARSKAKIKVRQPLLELRFKGHVEKEFLDLIKEELNLKKCQPVKALPTGKNWILEKEKDLKIALNIEITPELKEEGMIREIIRQIQELRKKAGLRPEHKISIFYQAKEKLTSLLEKNKNLILKESRAKKMSFQQPKVLVQKEAKIDQQILWLGIKVDP